MEQTYATKKTPKVNGFSDSEKTSGSSIPLSLSGAASSGVDDSRNRNLESELKSRINSNLGGRSGSAPGIISSLENRSGVDLSDVSIYHNSPKPAEIGALAYAQGSSVYIGPGQDKLLGHELTHVVQQKQGLVSSDSSIGGLPVNTSPALERAADNMAVTSAPETGYSGDGVVQGVFISPTGARESDKAIKHIEEVLNGSLNSLADQFITPGKSKTPEAKKVQKGISNARKNIHKKLKSLQQSKHEYDTSSIITECMNDVYKEIGFNKSSSLKAMEISYNSGSQAALDNYNEKQPLSFRNTREGLNHSMSSFKLPETAYAGVENIGEYDVNDKMEELTEGRMGNSATLASDLARTDEEKAKREASIKQFNNGAETARKGAAAIKDSDDNVSYEGLMGLFSNINKQVRGNSQGSGELRANKVSAGQMIGVGSAALPEDTYVTFSHIADQIKQIKRIPDKNLQKSQAIYLAAFAYQMTISEHMFSDGNGRTCRLFSDAILQAFGLPPSTPVQELGTAGKTMGNDFDFDAGAGYFLAGVQKSDETAKEKRAAQQIGEKTSNQTMGYRSDQMGELAQSDAFYDPTSSDPEQINLGLRRMYEKIKHPDPNEDPEVVSRRKRLFAEQRAAQLNEEYKAANSKPAETKPAEPKKKKSWWQFWK
ncbi:MAG: DUF4157 domain-containing protein [Oscillospiraceae bacterium]